MNIVLLLRVFQQGTMLPMMLMIMAAIWIDLMGGNLPSQPMEKAAFIPTEEAPTYHLLDGYDPLWKNQIEQGVEMAREYWGSYGPVHVWILGNEDGHKIDPERSEAFIDDYCRWRLLHEQRTSEECREYMMERFIEVADRGDSEAYLSWIQADQPVAELVFINVDGWHHEDEPVPDPILRGMHEYTHVYQKAFDLTPTWMMEGGAVFTEGWLPYLEGLRPRGYNLEMIMERAQGMRHTGFTIADMENIDLASEEVAEYYLELAYDTGGWAVAFMVYNHPGRSVSTLRDEFYPMVNELGWEEALARYVGMENKNQFYEAFEEFMNDTRQSQSAMLMTLQP
ncbi:MAG: hypothetical protein P8J89_08185 [Phycisphaerales bacterium]|nr:hypothetical protein [Phycisphaerales bacterium]